MARSGRGRGRRGRGEPAEDAVRLRDLAGVLSYTGRAIGLVWTTSRRLSVAIGALSLVAGLLPAAIAYVGKLIVDGVVRAAETGAAADRDRTLLYVACELGLVVALAGANRGVEMCQSLLRALLGQRVNEMILQKALTIALPDFEDSELYDRMTRARREASSRPLSLVRRAFGLVQNAISMVAYGGLLLGLSPLAVLVLVVAAVPAFVAETRFSRDAFRLFRWRAPEARMQMYLETVLAREDYAKEVKLFGLGPMLLARYRAIFDALFDEDRDLTVRRAVWGYLLGLVSTGAFYAAYAWIVITAAQGRISLGDMTMYLLVFKQGQSALSAMLSAIGGMYQDNLYLSTLYEYLEHESAVPGGTEVSGPRPEDGLVFEDVCFQYPGAREAALRGVTLQVPPGRKLAIVGQNGAGKTTLIKLLARLYEPTSGRILLDGRDLREWDVDALRRRIGIIFQDFVRYQLRVGDNIGVGDVDRLEDAGGWQRAAQMATADGFIEALPSSYETQLGSWFQDGAELSLGQWQKIALSRAFMRRDADVLVLDEPTASMDAEAEVRVFEHIASMTEGRMALLISHRFSTVRMADAIAVLEGGHITELGTHDELVALGGRYARLFELQARAYRDELPAVEGVGATGATR